jgi:hypothetical protein
MRAPVPACLAALVALISGGACGGDIGDGNASDGGAADASGASPDAAAIDCGASGGGSVTSTTAGAEVEPVVSAWYQIIDVVASALVIDERASNCDPDAIKEQPGQFVTIYFCDQLAVGEYDAVPALAGACPGELQASVTVQNELLQDLVDETTGTLTIQQVGDCIVGSFDTTSPEAEELSGSFMAYPCPDP